MAMYILPIKPVATASEITSKKNYQQAVVIHAKTGRSEHSDFSVLTGNARDEEGIGVKALRAERKRVACNGRHIGLEMLLFCL